MKNLGDVEFEVMNEKLITFASKAYPKFGNILIMAGGAGSGKGFILKNLIGLEGKTFDVDALKTLAAKSVKIRKRVKKEFGIDIEKVAADLKNPENVQTLHELIGDELKLSDRKMAAFYTSVLAAPDDRKPNVIFDVTLKSLSQLRDLTSKASKLGYDKKKIHIVWVINDIEVAKAQNAKRSRTVPVEILINTHRGVSQTMNDIVKMGKSLKSYMNGDIVFAFNKVKVDSSVAKSGKGGSYVKDALYIYVKKAGKSVTPLKKLSEDIKAKIKQYVPKEVDWS